MGSRSSRGTRRRRVPSSCLWIPFTRDEPSPPVRPDRFGDADPGDRTLSPGVDLFDRRFRGDRATWSATMRAPRRAGNRTRPDPEPRVKTIQSTSMGARPRAGRISTASTQRRQNPAFPEPSLARTPIGPRVNTAARLSKCRVRMRLPRGTMSAESGGRYGPPIGRSADAAGDCVRRSRSEAHPPHAHFRTNGEWIREG